MDKYIIDDMQNVIKGLFLLIVLTVGLHASEAKLKSSVSLVLMSMDYREYDLSGNILDSEKSSFNDLAGVDMQVSYLLSSSYGGNTRLEGNFMILGGYTNYAGSILGSGNPYGSYLSRTVNTIIDFDAALTRTQNINEVFALKYALGLGYRFWERALSASQIEDYIWYSFRTMLGFTYKVTKKLQVGGEFEYQYGFNETMYASNLGSTFDLGSADIMQFSIPFVYSYTDRMDLTLAYVYEKQTIDHSNAINGFYEPDSTAKNQYIKVGVDFKF